MMPGIDEQRARAELIKENYTYFLERLRYERWGMFVSCLAGIVMLVYSILRHSELQEDARYAYFGSGGFFAVGAALFMTFPSRIYQMATDLLGGKP